MIILAEADFLPHRIVLVVSNGIILAAPYQFDYMIGSHVRLFTFTCRVLKINWEAREK